MITTLVTVYFAINIFMAGRNYEMGSGDKHFERVGTTLLIAVLGTVLMLLDLTVNLWNWLAINTQIKFFFLWYFTSTFKNLEKERLERVSREVFTQLKRNNTWSNRLIYWCIRKVNKLNNYEFKE